MSQSTAYTQTPLNQNLSGGNIGSNSTPVWLQIVLAAAGVLALVWFINRRKGSQ